VAKTISALATSRQARGLGIIFLTATSRQARGSYDFFIGKKSRLSLYLPVRSRKWIKISVFEKENFLPR
ncbi:MAG: hypothetical protein RR522_05110, partial [Alistipes sp.]